MIDEDHIPGYFVHNRWVWVIVFGLFALLTEHPVLIIITIAMFVIAVKEEWEEDELDWSMGTKEDSYEVPGA